MTLLGSLRLAGPTEAAAARMADALAGSTGGVPVGLAGGLSGGGLPDPVLADPVLADPMLADPMLAEEMLAALPAARDVVNQRLIGAAYREHLTGSPADVVWDGQTAFLSLADGGVLVTRARRHGFDRIEVDEIVSVDPAALLERITGRDDAATRAVATELIDATVNLALAYARRARRLREPVEPVSAVDDPDAYARFLESFATEGHNLHPCGRTRLGWSVADLLAHDLEADATPVSFVAVRRDRHLGHEIGPDFLNQSTVDPRRYAVTPVHPWQLRRLRARYGDDDLLVPLDETWPAAPTAAVRTMLLPAGSPARYLKLSLDILVTSTRRTISVASTHNGPVLSRLLAQRLDTDRVLLLAETAGSAADLPGGDRDLSAIARAGLSGRLRPGEIPVPGSALTAVVPGSALTAIARGPAHAAGLVPAAIAPGSARVATVAGSAQAAGLGPAPIAVVSGTALTAAAAGRTASTSPGHETRSVLIELVDRFAATRGLAGPAAALAFTDEYARLLLPPLLTLATRHGIAIEAHLQNCIPTFVGGVPHRLVLRDFAGLRVHPDRLRDEPPLWPGSVVRTGSLDTMRAKIAYTALQAHLGEVIRHLVDRCGLDEAAAWSRVRGVVDELYDTLRGDQAIAGRAAEDHAFFTAPTVPHKALLSMRLSGQPGDLYGPVGNPLR